MRFNLAEHLLIVNGQFADKSLIKKIYLIHNTRFSIPININVPSSTYNGASAHQCMRPARGVTAAIGMDPLGRAAGFNCADMHRVGFEYTCKIKQVNKILLILTSPIKATQQDIYVVCLLLPIPKINKHKKLIIALWLFGFT